MHCETRRIIGKREEKAKEKHKKIISPSSDPISLP
jgi:hypothetical protein